MRVPTTLLLVLVAILAKASAAEDLYWEGEDDLANEFLEVDRDSGISGHLRRLKRAWFWDTPTTAAPEPEENFTEDDEPIEDEDNLNGGSGAREPELEPELKEKTLRVTFVVMEPYLVKYSNRDSPEFQNISKSLAEAVNTVFRDLPGTHRASLVRIQSRPADEFSCKVTLDIVVTGDDTNKVSETLREYIRVNRKLGKITVYDEDYGATVLYTGFVDSETIDQNENHYNEVERGDSNPDATILPDIVTPDNDNIFGENPIGVDESETTEEINPYEVDNDYGRPAEETTFFRRPDEQGPDDISPNEGSPDERRNEIERPEGSPDVGRNDFGTPDERRNDYERPEGSPDDRRNDYGRPDYDRPSERPDNRSQGQDFPYTELPETTRSYSCPDDAMSCDDTRCVPLNLRCDGRRDCDDGADELSCPDKSCGADDFHCDDGKCIENSRRCNRQIDCPGGEDEAYCECRSDEFRCQDDGSCIENRKRCNGNNECMDGSDELNCGNTACGPDSFRCDAESSVVCATRCDGNQECDAGEDEDGCLDDCDHVCDGICLQDFQICDGKVDCSDGSDENDCNNCDGPNDFRCQNGECILAAQHCNDLQECNDGSDEINCNSTMIPEPYGCLDNQFTCRDGTCINSIFSCDGHVDCNDHSDEENCPCQENEWQCVSGQCIPINGYCDGMVDCPDLSDEKDCSTTYRPFTTAYPAYPYPQPPTTQRPILTTTSNPYDKGPDALNIEIYPAEQTVRYVNTGGDVVFSCRDKGPNRTPVRWIREGGRPLKVGSTDRKGRLEITGVTPSDSGIYICQAPKYLGNPKAEVQVILSVEKSPVTSRPAYIPCPPHQATCGNGQCIARTAICDGNVDCLDGSDEESCHNNGMCEPNEYQCANRKCVLKTWICDAEDDCGDGSDEQNCGPAIPGQQCLPVEFACATNDQCVPKTFHCDGQSDCLDKSDEIGCAPVYVTRPPVPSNLKLNPGDTLTLRCEAVGVPTPLISWRLNWGNVPEKCESTSSNGIGVLTCPNMQSEDSGAYSCEAINNKGTIFAAPDAIVYVNRTADVCPAGYFNSEAQSESECIRCFCFGKSTHCQSADLFIFNMPTPLGEGGTRLFGVSIGYNGVIQKDEDISNQYYYQPLRNGATVTKLDHYGSSWTRNSDAHPYLSLPESYNRNQLTSYGGSIKYRLSPHTFQSYGERDRVPDIIILGKYQNLFHYSQVNRARELYIEARLTPNYWEKPSSSGLIPASREDIMMTLDDVEMILLRADLNNAGTNITQFAMESAQLLNVGLGAASLVEECECPKGYKGRSCEKCVDGYELQNSGPWNGVCAPKAPCPPMTYGDPRSGGDCRPCPCPLTNRENQFASGCSLGPGGNVVCHCLPGYEGSDCSYCANNYFGNPLIPGDSCKPQPQDNCDPVGTAQVRLPDECVCKENVQGRYCDQCKSGSFYMSNDFKHGCALCFCSGIPPQSCVSSTWRRRTTTVRFNVPTVVDQLKVYNSAPIGPAGAVRYITPVDTGLHPALVRGEVNINTITRSEPSIFYWGLQDSFAGDKVTSYGGYLTYQLRNVQPNPSLRNTAADVQLVSENSLTFLYFGDATPTSDGFLNVSVQFIESSRWQRSDGKPVTREHFLLALADVKTILIKATYSSNTDIASIESASIDTADEYGDGPMAQHVEQCMCPAGYIGTSCEDCAPGYTRSLSGLYLRHCVPCDCNGHSNKCHPESGECFECNDNTEGAQCEYCQPGYEIDQENNCVPISQTTHSPICNCDPRGEEFPCDSSGYCSCKQNVEGVNCDRCRPGTFGLTANNPLGCTACYCSGVTTDCHEATHYSRIIIPAPIFGENYGGYTLMDINAERVINDQFVPVVNESELMYVFSDQPISDLYWSLPVFPGNRVLSYGGTISLTQEFKSTGKQDVSVPDKDVILVGESQSVFWTIPRSIRSGETLSYQVPLREDRWYVLNSINYATRDVFMSILKNLKRVLVRATLTQQNIMTTSIADVSMETAAVSYDPTSRAAKGIEECRCPDGYTGTSCESCAVGYYKDRGGYCRQCPCNGHDCQLGNNEVVICFCKSPYSGSDCSTIGGDTLTDISTRPPPTKSTVVVRITSPTIKIQEVGSTVNFTCQARSRKVRVPLQVNWYKADGNLPQDRSQVDRTSGVLLITNLQVSDSGKYICQTSDGISTEQAIATLKVPSNDMTPPTVSISPSVMEYMEGSRIELTCTTTGNPAPRITWQRASNRALPRFSETYDALLIIDNASVDDSGEYRCMASNAAGSEVRTAIVTVRPRDRGQSENLKVSAREPTLNEGQSTRVVCTGTTNVPAGTIDWVRQDGSQFLPNVRADNGVLSINVARRENEGVYICQTESPDVNPVLVVLTIIPTGTVPPSEVTDIVLSVNQTTIPAGDRGQVECMPRGEPLPLIKWSKHPGSLGPGTSQRENTLIITNAQESDSGYYRCEGIVDGKTVVRKFVYIDIEKREKAKVEIYPQAENSATLGSEFRLYCTVIGGIPPPVVTWDRAGRALSRQAQILQNNVLSFQNVEVNDEGEYTCTATNEAGSVSASAILKVRSPPVIRILPDTYIKRNRGDPVNVECRADGYPEPEVSIKSSSGLRVLVPPTPRIAVLTIPSLSDSDDGVYLCTASSAAGITEEEFAINVERGDTSEEPDEGSTPNVLRAIEHQEARITCNASDDFYVVWGRADRNQLQYNAQQVGNELIFYNASKSDSGKYECTFINRRTNEVQQSAYTSLAVITPPKITLRPPVQTANPGQSPTVECLVEGDDIISVSWRPVDAIPSSRVEFRGSTLIFRQIEVEDAGKYECIAMNSIANRSKVAEVIVSEETDRATSESNDNEQFAHLGAAVHLSCNVSQPDVRIKWMKDGMPVPRTVSQKNDGSLFIRLAQKSDSGRYDCLIRDVYGRYTTNYINLHIEGPRNPSNSEALVAIDQTRKMFRVGERVDVLCRAKSRDVAVKWERFGTKQYVESRTYGDGALLYIPEVQELDAGVYRCTGVERNGFSTYDDFNLEVLPGENKPVFPTSERDTTYTVRLGNIIDLPCIHNLEEPVSYEWKREYSQLPANIQQNDRVLHLNGVTEADAGTYVCRVTNNRAKLEARATLRITGLVPKFNGDGWVALPTLQDAYMHFDIEISFKPSDQNGVIFYNAQNNNGTGDYMILQLIDGIPELTVKFDTAMPLTVTGDRPLQLNVWHTIRLSRSGPQVTMAVDNTGPFVGELPPYTVLDLNAPLYIGGLPDQRPPELVQATGFFGCVSMLILGKEEKVIMDSKNQPHNVYDCDTCNPNQCLNGGVCQEARNDRGYTCLCPTGFAGQNCDRPGEACHQGLCGPGKCTDTLNGYKCACPVTYTGKNCDVKQNIDYPAFTGSAYLAIKPPNTSRFLLMSMKIKAKAPITDGIIMYCAQSPRGYGGFTSLAVRDGRLEFRYDVGDGNVPIILTSNSNLQPNEWTGVRIARVGTDVSLRINMIHNYNATLASGKDLYLQTPMFVGGVDDTIILNNNTGVTGGFSGCIKDVTLHGDQLDLINDSILSANVQECVNLIRGDIPEFESLCSQCRNGGYCLNVDSTSCTCEPGFSGVYCERRTPVKTRPQDDPCASQPCRNGGTCKLDRSTAQGYSCDCQLGYSGLNCVTSFELLQSASFDGNGYLSLPADYLQYKTLNQEPALVALAFNTKYDGVLLYQNEEKLRYGGDFILLRVNDSVVVVDWDLGGGKNSLAIPEILVTDEERHEIILQLNKDGTVELTVDKNPRTALSNGISNVMNADSKIYLGGIPDHLNTENYYPGFRGCIEQIEFSAGRSLNLVDVAIGGKNVERCKKFT